MQLWQQFKMLMQGYKMEMMMFLSIQWSVQRPCGSANSALRRRAKGPARRRGKQGTPCQSSPLASMAQLIENCPLSNVVDADLCVKRTERGMRTAVWISMDETLARISLTLACGNSRRVSGGRRFRSTLLSVDKALISAVGLGKRLQSRHIRGGCES